MRDTSGMNREKSTGEDGIRAPCDVWALRKEKEGSGEEKGRKVITSRKKSYLQAKKKAKGKKVGRYHPFRFRRSNRLEIYKKNGTARSHTTG